MSQAFQLISGNYGGQPTAGTFNTALNQFVDPYAAQPYKTALKTININDMSKNELKAMNAQRYGGR